MQVGSPDLRSVTEVVIAKELANTPMAGTEKFFVEAGKKYNVDPFFLVAIGHHESKYASVYSAETNSQRHNYAGVMTFDKAGKRSLRQYNSWEEAIYDHAKVIRETYLNRGKTTIGTIWHTYAPLAENINSSWGFAVASKYIELKNKI